MTVQWKKEKNETGLHSDFLMHYNNRILQSGGQYNLMPSHLYPKQVELKMISSCCAMHPVPN